MPIVSKDFEKITDGSISVFEGAAWLGRSGALLGQCDLFYLKFLNPHFIGFRQIRDTANDQAAHEAFDLATFSCNAGAEVLRSRFALRPEAPQTSGAPERTILGASKGFLGTRRTYLRSWPL
jgi:hypothetical protein